LVLANDQRSRTTGHSLSPASKESLQHFGASPGQNAGANLHAMIQAGVIQYLHHRADSARLGVISAVNQALDPGLNQGTGTHGARFNCSKQLTVFEAMVAEGGTRFAQGDDLRVSSGVAIGKVAVSAAPDDVAFAHHNCADRNFSCLECALCGAKRFFHEQLVGLRLGASRKFFQDNHSI